MKRLAKSVIICIILAITVSVLHNVLSWKDTTGDYLSATRQLYNTEDNLIDVAFVGSSHVFCGIYPNVLWEKFGIASFDMSVSGQDKTAALYQLKELYKTQKPKAVFVDLFAVTYDRQSLASNEYRNYLSLRPSVNAYEAIDEYVKPDEKKDYLFRFPIIHSRYKELTKYDFVSSKFNEFGRGELFKEGTTEMDDLPQYIHTGENTGSISEINKKWIDDMISLCRENGSEIIFLVMPFYGTDEELDTIAGAEEYLNSLDIDWIDLNHICYELYIDPKTDFFDQWHLNSLGAAKTSDYLSNVCSNLPDYTDHRGDTAYYQWDLDARWQHNQAVKIQMQEAKSADQFVEALKSYEGGVTVISLEAVGKDNKNEYSGYLSPLGMEDDLYTSGGKWIYQNGTLTRISDNTSYSGEYTQKLSKYDTLRVFFKDTYDPENIMIGNNALQLSEHLTFVVYDTLLEEIVLNRGF